MVMNKSISIIAACKNRVDPLKVSLMSWLSFDQVKEVIIVDWSSDEPINYLTKFDSRVKVIRVDNKEYFNQPQPLNLAASIATGDYIFHLDGDHIINPYKNSIPNNLPKDDEFFCGELDTKNNIEYWNDKLQGNVINVEQDTDDYEEYLYRYSPFYRYLVGMVLVKADHFRSVGGYNEKLGDCYAYEDVELYKRLEVYGLKKIKHSVRSYEFIHIPHGDDHRIKNFKGFEGQDDYTNQINNDLSPEFSGDELRWQVEYAISEHQTKLNRSMIGEISDYKVNNNTKWEITNIDDQNYYAIDITFDKNSIKKINLPLVRYISLEESFDRRLELENSFKKYGIKFKSYISKRFHKCNDKVTGIHVDSLNDGTKGCAISHLKMIKDWYDNTDEDYAFFAEDDLSLETLKYWGFTWEEFIKKLPEDADCIQLLTVRKDYETFKIRKREWCDWGATAYIINRDYAKKIIDTYIKGNEYHLEIPNLDIQPLVENLIFCLGDTYTIPMFVENINFISTFKDRDDDVNNGSKNNHKHASEIVLNWWSRKHLKIDKVEKTELEELITKYSFDTENPENNFNLGVYYYDNGHTAPALSYFLRCAERANETDPDLAYEALIKGSYCYFKQGTRDQSGRGLLWQAQMFLPMRPEAYFLLVRYAENMQWWQDCYSTSELALMTCDFNLKPLRTNVEYPGKWGLIFEKGLASWWWGKVEESRTLLESILKEYGLELNDEQKKVVVSNIKKIGGKVDDQFSIYDEKFIIRNKKK